MKFYELQDNCKSVSFCITVKDRLHFELSGEKLSLLQNCLLTLKNQLNSLNIFDLCEIVISSWDKDNTELEEFLEYNFNDNHKLIIIKDQPFSRGRGRNIAYENAVCPIIAFIDADMIFIRNTVIVKGIEFANKDLVYFPAYYEFTEHNGIEKTELNKGGTGNFFIKRSIYECAELSWPEKYHWGGEDTELFENINRKYITIRDITPGFYHQWHGLSRDIFHEYKNGEIPDVMPTPGVLIKF